MHLSKVGQPNYKPADWFRNRRPVYKPVSFTISSQHIYLLQFWCFVGWAECQREQCSVSEVVQQLAANMAPLLPRPSIDAR